MFKCGFWIEFEFVGDVLEMKVNKCKFFVLLLLCVLGMDDVLICVLFIEFMFEVEFGEDKSVGMGVDEVLLCLFIVLCFGDLFKCDKVI